MKNIRGIFFWPLNSISVFTYYFSIVLCLFVPNLLLEYIQVADQSELWCQSVWCLTSESNHIFEHNTGSRSIVTAKLDFFPRVRTRTPTDGTDLGYDIDRFEVLQGVVKNVVVSAVGGTITFNFKAPCAAVSRGSVPKQPVLATRQERQQSARSNGLGTTFCTRWQQPSQHFQRPGRCA